MTKEEAKAKLEDVAKNLLWGCGEYSEALEMAIKVLELEPCSSCITFKRYAKQIGFEIEQEPKKEWIPVVVGDPTTLPKPDENVLVQYASSMYVVHRFVDTYLKHTEDDDDSGWYSEQGEYLCTFYEIDAWQPLPNSYKKSEVGE